MNPELILKEYYDVNSQLYKILLKHSMQVRDKALMLAQKHPELKIDLDFVSEAAMLHDIGIFMCDASGICCYGTHHYIEHGYLGADLLRSHGLDRHALVAERHTGTGLTLSQIRENKLPVPERDMQPQSVEEKLICYADKFYSKSKINQELPIEKIKRQLSRYGNDQVVVFESWQKLLFS